MSDVVLAGEDVLRRLEKVNNFESRHGIKPLGEAGKVLENMVSLAESISSRHEPETWDEVVENDLKRRLEGDALLLEMELSPKAYDLNTITSIYSVPSEDLDSLRGWLEDNRQEVLDAVERLFQTSDIRSRDLALPLDIPSVRRQSEEVAEVSISKYHKKIGKLLQSLTSAGEFLRDIDAVPTRKERSYFNLVRGALAISIPEIIRMSEDSGLDLNERELIKLYGHEGMGHALNQVMSTSNGLPFFLTKNSAITLGTMESVAQFYQRTIFEDLKNSPETQRELGIDHKFSQIYQEEQDNDLLEEYKARLFQYVITVMADKKLGHPQDKKTIQRKRELIEGVALEPGYPRTVVENYSKPHNYDSEGNLNGSLLAELRYCARSVDRSLAAFAENGMPYEGKHRSTIDEALLKGFWTPQGQVEIAKLVASQ